MTKVQGQAASEREESVFSPEDVLVLGSRGEGWEALWGRLYGVLNDRLHRMLVGGRQNDESTWRANPKWFRNPHDAMDFMGDYLLSLDRKARSGTLLTGYDGEAIVEVYLTAPSHIKRRAVDWITREKVRQGIGQEQENAPDPVAPPVEPTRTGLAVEGRPIRIAWSGQGAITAVVRMAILQCWPRLDPRQTGRSRLERDLADTLSAAGVQDPIAELDRRHRAAERRLRDKIAGISKRMARQTGLHQTTRQQLEQGDLGARVDLLLCPLSPEDVRDLYDITLPAVYKQLSRYRRAYPELFADLHALLGQVTEA